MKALEESILHWERIRDGQEEERAGENCALCKEFGEDSCRECPVYKKTRVNGCLKTGEKVWPGVGCMEPFRGI